MTEYNLSELVQQATTDVSGLDTPATVPSVSIKTLVINKIREANPDINVNLEHLEYTFDVVSARQDLGVSNEHDDYYNNGTEIRYFEHTRREGAGDLRMVPEFVGKVPNGSRLYNARTLIFKYNELPIGSVLKQILPNLSDVYSYDLYSSVTDRIHRAVINEGIDIMEGVIMTNWDINENHRILIVKSQNGQIDNVKSPVNIATGYHLIHFVRESIVKEDIGDINTNTLDIAEGDFLTGNVIPQN